MGLAQQALEVAAAEVSALRNCFAPLEGQRSSNGVYTLLRFLDFFRNRPKALLDRGAMEV
jgi:hypothetical protein